MTLALDEGSDSRVHGRDAKALARRMAALKAEAKEKGYFIVPLWEKAFRIGELLLFLIKMEVHVVSFCLTGPGSSA